MSADKQTILALATAVAVFAFLGALRSSTEASSVACGFVCAACCALIVAVAIP